MTLTQTYIDSQTLGEAVRALDAGNPIYWSRWNAESVLTATCVLISVPELRISPSARFQEGGIGPFDGTLGIHGIMASELSTAIKPYIPDSQAVAEASRTVRKWAADNPAKIAHCLQLLEGSPDYQAWIDYESSRGWLAATRIINGIVDEAFLTPIARATSISQTDAMAVLNRSRDDRILGDWLRPTYQGEDKEMAKIMFSAGALIRGRYHDRVAEKSGTSIIHHPMRDAILKPIKSVDGVSFSSSNALEYLGKIIIASSLTEVSAQMRVQKWCQDIKLVRDSLIWSKSSTIPSEDVSDELALKTAVRAAQDAGVRANSRKIEQIIHHAVGLGAGAATSFLLSPWMFPVGYVASEVALRTIEDKVFPMSWGQSAFRLNRLARSIPGRLIYKR